MRVYVVLDAQRVFVLHLEPVADLLTYLERRHERLHFRLSTDGCNTR